MRGFSSFTSMASITTLVVENVSQQALCSSQNYLGLFGGRAHPHVVVGFGGRGFSAAASQLSLKAASQTARQELHCNKDLS